MNKIIIASLMAISVLLLSANYSYAEVSDSYFEKYKTWIEDYKVWAEKTITNYKEWANDLQQQIISLENDIQTKNEKITELGYLVSDLKSKNNHYLTKLETANKKIDSFESKQQSLINEIDKKNQNYDSLYDKILEYEKIDAKPKAVIDGGFVHFTLFDTKGNVYNWQMPIEDYEEVVSADRNLEQVELTTDSGEIFPVVDHTNFVLTSFTKVIDQVYDNSDSNYDFILQTWFIASQITVYSYDIGEYPRYAVETLVRGTGDCEDTTILIADMIKSSKYTKGWDLDFVYMDSDNPGSPDTANHVILRIDNFDDDGYYYVESTARTFDEMDQWNHVDVRGWWFEV